MQFDITLFNIVHGLAGRNTFLDIAIVIIGEYLPYALAVAILVWLFLKKDIRTRFFEMLSVGLSIVLARGILMPLVAFAANRPRPYLVLSFEPLIAPLQSSAFPSGHATFFFAVAMAVWFLNRTWGGWFLIAAAAISAARVIAGVHWPLDVVAGALVGIVSAAVVWRFIPQPKSASPPVS